MNLPPICLLEPLMKIFHLSSLLMCIDDLQNELSYPDIRSCNIFHKNGFSNLDENEVFREIPFYFIHPENVLNFTLGLQERILISCSAEILNKANSHHFGRNFAWFLTEEAAENLYSSLPLRLDSLLLSYKETLQSKFLIHEYYNIINKRPIKKELGILNENGFILKEDPFIWIRRRNLHGVTLINSAMFWDKLNNMVKNEPPSGGLFPEILGHLQESLNFTTHWIKPKDSKWGGFNEENGQWEGIIGDLHEKKVHLGHTGLTISSDRFRAVDFSFGIKEELLTMIKSKNMPSNEVNMKAFIKIFSLEIWTVYLVFLVIFSFQIAFVLLWTSVENHNLCQWIQKIPFGLGVMFLSVLQIDTRLSTSNLTLKMIYLVIAMANFFVFQLYTSDLTAQMTVTNKAENIGNFQFLIDQEYTLLVSFGSIYHFLLKNSPPESPKGKAYEKITKVIDTETDCNFDNCLIKMVKEKPLIVLYGSSLNAIGESDLQILTSFEESLSSQLGTAFQKDSDLKDLFNYYYVKMRQSGLMEKIDLKWLKNSSPEDLSERIFVNFPPKIGFGNIFFPNGLLLCGMATAFCIVFAEKIIKFIFKYSN